MEYIDSEMSNFSSIINSIMWGVIVFIAFWLVKCISKFTKKTNKYVDEIEKYEIDLIDKILKEKYNKSKNKVNKKRCRNYRCCRRYYKD